MRTKQFQDLIHPRHGEMVMTSSLVLSSASMSKASYSSLPSPLATAASFCFFCFLFSTWSMGASFTNGMKSWYSGKQKMNQRWNPLQKTSCHFAIHNQAQTNAMGLDQLQMAPLVPDDSLLRFCYFRKSLHVPTWYIFYLGQVAPSSITFTTDTAQLQIHPYFTRESHAIIS